MSEIIKNVSKDVGDFTKEFTTNYIQNLVTESLSGIVSKITAGKEQKTDDESEKKSEIVIASGIALVGQHRGYSPSDRVWRTYYDFGGYAIRSNGNSNIARCVKRYSEQRNVINNIKVIKNNKNLESFPGKSPFASKDSKFYRERMTGLVKYWRSVNVENDICNDTKFLEKFELLVDKKAEERKDVFFQTLKGMAKEKNIDWMYALEKAQRLGVDRNMREMLKVVLITFLAPTNERKIRDFYHEKIPGIVPDFVQSYVINKSDNELCKTIGKAIDMSWLGVEKGFNEASKQLQKALDSQSDKIGEILQKIIAPVMELVKKKGAKSPKKNKNDDDDEENDDDDEENDDDNKENADTKENDENTEENHGGAVDTEVNNDNIDNIDNNENNQEENIEEENQVENETIDNNENDENTETTDNNEENNETNDNNDTNNNETTDNTETVEDVKENGPNEPEPNEDPVDDDQEEKSDREKQPKEKKKAPKVNLDRFPAIKQMYGDLQQDNVKLSEILKYVTNSVSALRFTWRYIKYVRYPLADYNELARFIPGVRNMFHQHERLTLCMLEVSRGLTLGLCRAFVPVVDYLEKIISGQGDFEKTSFDTNMRKAIGSAGRSLSFTYYNIVPYINRASWLCGYKTTRSMINWAQDTVNGCGNIFGAIYDQVKPENKDEILPKFIKVLNTNLREFIIDRCLTLTKLIRKETNRMLTEFFSDSLKSDLSSMANKLQNLVEKLPPPINKIPLKQLLSMIFEILIKKSVEFMVGKIAKPTETLFLNPNLDNNEETKIKDVNEKELAKYKTDLTIKSENDDVTSIDMSNESKGGENDNTNN